MNIDASALSAIPYLDTTDLSRRLVTTTLFCVAGKWRMWMPVESRLIEIQTWPAESVYFSDSPQSTDDIALHFLDFMAQRANVSTVQKPTLGLHDDLFNLAASLAKEAACPG